jgi:hypothetical protein
MSTKCTLGHSDAYHLYEECFDSDKVYLRLDGNEMSVELDTRSNRKSVTVCIDVGIWREIVFSWLKSHWAQNPERDHAKKEIHLDDMERIAESGTKRKEDLIPGSHTWHADMGVNGNSITIKELPLENGNWLKPILPYKIKFSDEQNGNGFWVAEDPDMGLVVVAPTVTKLAVELYETLACLWEIYVQGDPSVLTSDAQELRAKLERNFIEEACTI